MPLHDYECGCGVVEERYVHSTQLGETQTCAACGASMTRLLYTDGWSRKTGVFPFTSTHIDGTGKPIVVESLGHLRSLEATYGVLATAFSQDPSNSLETPKELPQFREGGRKFEGFSLPQYVAQQRGERLQRALRNMELRKYAGRPRVARRG